MISLYRDPQGKKIFDGTTSESQSYHIKNISISVTDYGDEK